DRAIGRRAVADQLRALDHAGRTGGVVISAVVDHGLVARTAVWAELRDAESEMVVVTADDDVFVLVGAGTGKDADYVLDVRPAALAPSHFIWNWACRVCRCGWFLSSSMNLGS